MKRTPWYLSMISTPVEGGGGGETTETTASVPSDSKTEAQAPAPQQETPEALGDAGKRALAAERQARREAETKLAATIQALEERGRLLAEQTAQVAQVAAERDALQLANERVSAAIAHGLDAQLADRIKGATPEEIQADAAVLKALLQDKQGVTSVLPPDPSQGRGAGGKGTGSLAAGRDLFNQTHRKDKA